jgi:molybdate transport system substrate-binding protein
VRWVAVVSMMLAMLGVSLAVAAPVCALDAWECPVPGAEAIVTPATLEPLPEAAFPEEGGNLTVFAAASLAGPFDALKAAIEAEHPSVTITLSYAGSQTLVTQAIEGAPADVLALAAIAPMDRAIAEGVVERAPVVFATNRLAIVTPPDDPAGIESAADLAREEVLLVLAGPDVPAGTYARQSICLMAGDSTTYGDDFVARVAANVVSEEDDVTSVLTKVLLGEADAGIVYVSDVTGEVRAIPIPDAVNVSAAYPIAAMTAADLDLAAAFIGFVRSDAGRQILADFGFAIPADDDA